MTCSHAAQPSTAKFSVQFAKQILSIHNYKAQANNTDGGTLGFICKHTSCDAFSWQVRAFWNHHRLPGSMLCSARMISPQKLSFPTSLMLLAPPAISLFTRLGLHNFALRHLLIRIITRISLALFLIASVRLQLKVRQHHLYSVAYSTHFDRNKPNLAFVGFTIAGFQLPQISEVCTCAHSLKSNYPNCSPFVFRNNELFCPQKRTGVRRNL